MSSEPGVTKDCDASDPESDFEDSATRAQLAFTQGAGSPFAAVSGTGITARDPNLPWKPRRR